jgi:hypothetical protein
MLQNHAQYTYPDVSQWFYPELIRNGPLQLWVMGYREESNIAIPKVTGTIGAVCDERT